MDPIESPIPYELTTFPKDRFQVMAPLGQGGMGKVFLVRDRHLNRKVALKVLKDPEDPGGAARLLAEAQFQASLDHPHIVQVLEVGLWRRQLCLVMEHIDGPSLDTLAPSLTVRERAELIAQAARGIHAAHLKGILHRDLKPQNLLVETREGGGRRAVVADFGLAREGVALSGSLDGHLVGSPPYMSPEQATGGSFLDARSDVYGLGATLYTVLTGQTPFGSLNRSLLPRWMPTASEDPTNPSAMEILRRVLEEDPLPPRRLVPNLPVDLETIVLKCLEKPPHLRYSSAAELAQDLERFLEGQPILARQPGLLRRADAWRRRNPVLATALALTLALGSLGAVAAYGWAQRATRSAELAARYEATVQTVADRLRLTSLTGAAGRRLDLSWVLDRRREIEADLRRHGRIARAPGAYALGRIDQLLGYETRAYRQLQEAWDLGHRTPACRWALGRALLQQYDETSNAALRHGGGDERLQDPAARQFLTDALKLLRGGTPPAAERDVVEAWIAYVEGRDEAAHQAAQRALEEYPWMYEAWHVRHLLWGRTAARQPDLAGFEAADRQAREALERALALAPGDLGLQVAKGLWLSDRAYMLQQRTGRPQVQGYLQAVAVIEQALRTQPEHFPALLVHSNAMRGLNFIAYDGDDAELPRELTARKALESARLAATLDPSSLRARGQLAWGLVAQGLTARAQGGTMDPWLAEAETHTAALVQAAPERLTFLNLQNNVLWHRVNEGRLIGKDARAEIRAQLSRLEQRIQRWPLALEVRVQQFLLLNAVADAEAAVGDWKAAEAGLQAAQATVEGVFRVQPDNTYWRLNLVRLWQKRAAFQALQGGDPDASLQVASRELNQVVQRSGGDHSFLLEVAFDLQAAELHRTFERTGHVAPDHWRGLERLLHPRAARRLSEDESDTYRAQVLRLKALVRPSPEATADLRSLRWRLEGQVARRQSWESVGLRALAAALQVHEARLDHSPSAANARQEARRTLERCFNFYPGLRWDFRVEWDLLHSARASGNTGM